VRVYTIFFAWANRCYTVLPDSGKCPDFGGKNVFYRKLKVLFDTIMGFLFEQQLCLQLALSFPSLMWLPFIGHFIC